MASSATTLSVFILCLISCPIVRTLNIEVVESSKCLKVPAVEFVGSVKATIETILQVTSFVSKYTSKVMGNSRLSHAITDCLDLLDLSVEELGWTISASQKTHGKGNGTGNLSNDLRTWLSGALINQDTCIEGFDGTHSIIKSAVSRTLTKVTSLVRSILLMVDPTPKTRHRTTSHSKATHGSGKIHDPKANTEVHHPYWFTREDRKLIQTINGVTANVTVAADGTGNFTTVNEALNLAPNSSNARFVIYIKKGVYNEYIEISKKKWNIMMIGDGMDVTILRGNRSFIDGWTTYRSSTFAVKGRGFIARDITFENTAGPQKHQAVAFRSDSDLSVLYRCAFRGYQDTLYAHSMRQFYRECTITGTVDFIFGDGSVVFQNCNILARKGLPNQKNTITAQGRKEPNEPSGFSIQFSNFSGDSELLASLNSTQTYLGRPWKLYSRTVIMQCYMSEAIMPQGWLEWNTTFALDSLYYAEYMNYGPGAGLGKRVKWPGFHVLNDTAQADYFTVAQFILGNSWLPSTGVKYTAGLLP